MHNKRLHILGEEGKKLWTNEEVDDMVRGAGHLRSARLEEQWKEWKVRQQQEDRLVEAFREGFVSVQNSYVRRSV